MADSKNKESTPRKRRPPATTLQGRENQMISLAVDLAEKQLSDGTASAQVVTHYLKLATTREKLEQEKLARENELLKARSESLESGKKIEELYANAIDAMRGYAGHDEEVIDDYED